MHISQPRPTDVLELEDFIADVHKNLDVRDQDSILAMGPKLAALANNKRFLGRFLSRTLATPGTFQDGNSYAGPVMLLGGGPGCGDSRAGLARCGPGVADAEQSWRARL